MPHRPTIWRGELAVGLALLAGCTPGGDKGSVAGLDRSTGRTLWTTPNVTEVSGFNQSQAVRGRTRTAVVVLTAQSMLGVDPADGKVCLAPATPKGYQPAGEFTLPRGDGKCWAHPALADGILYVRRGDVLMAFDLHQTPPP